MSDNPTNREPSPPPAESKSAPWGPGPLMIFGLALVGLAVYCAVDLFVRNMPEEWRQAGNAWYIPMNWAIMIAAAVGAGCAFVLAVKRSKEPASGKM